MILLLAYSTLRRRSELTAVKVKDLKLWGAGQGLFLLRQSKTDQTREGILAALDLETTYSMRSWINLPRIIGGLLSRGVTGNRLNLTMDRGQKSLIFKSLAINAKLDPKEISGHSTRISAAQDLLDSGAGIGRIMAKFGWRKVDPVMKYVGVGKLPALSQKQTKKAQQNFEIPLLLPQPKAQSYFSTILKCPGYIWDIQKFPEPC